LGSGGMAGGEGVGGGEDMVQDFVRMHMMSILTPFAERVHELQAQVEHLAGELSSVREAADGHESRLDQQEGQVSSLQGGLTQAGERLEKAQADLAALKKEKSRLDGNHEMTKAAVGKTKEMLAQVTASVEALQQALQDSAGNVGGLERALAEAEKRIMEHAETRLDKQGRACRELNERQAELTKLCQQTKTLGESTSSAVKQLQIASGQQIQADLDSLASLCERTSSLEAKSADLQEHVEKHTESLKSVDREIQHINTWSGQVADVKRLHAQQSEVAASLEAQASRLEGVEAEIGQMRSDTVSERQYRQNELGELEQRVSKNIADLVRWRDDQKAQCDIISSTGQRLHDLESGQSKLASRADASERELHALCSWRQAAARQLDAQAGTLEAVRGDLQRAEERLQGASQGLKGLKAEVCTDKELLAKLGSRLDVCCTYFNGLGKGLQDTHRQIVSGESGLLPPKAGGTVLPAIPRGPRTPRTSVSPRRPLANAA